MIETQRLIPLTTGVGVAVVVGAGRKCCSGSVRDRRCTVCGVGVSLGDVAAGVGQCGDGVLLASVIVTLGLCSCRGAFAVRFADLRSSRSRPSVESLPSLTFRYLEPLFESGTFV